MAASSKKIDIYILALVIQEASCGDKDAANKRLHSLIHIPILEITDDTRAVAQSLIDENAVSVAFEEDALHIAIAYMNGMDFLLTWNFSHINNVLKNPRSLILLKNLALFRLKYVHQMNY